MGWVPEERSGKAYLWHNGYSLKSGGYCYNALVPADRAAVTVLTNLDVHTAHGISEAVADREMTLHAYTN